MQRPSAWGVALSAPQRIARALQQRIQGARSAPLSHFLPSPLGRDASGSRLRVPTAVLIWVALALVASNLTLVALRSEITRVRYEVSQGTGELQQLDEQGRALTLRLRQLHDPRRLNEIARARGFGAPERIVELE